LQNFKLQTESVIYRSLFTKNCDAVLEALTTKRKVAGSIPDGFIRFFYRYILSGCTVVLGSTQPLTKMSTRNIFWGVKWAGG